MKEKSENKKYDCTDCVIFSICYLRRHGKTDNVACDDIELNPWDKEEEKKDERSN